MIKFCLILVIGLCVTYSDASSNSTRFASYHFKKKYLVDNNANRTYGQSVAFCESKSAKLVQIKSKAEQTYLDGRVDSNFRYWLGVANVTGYEIPDKFIDSSNITWINWGNHEPENVSHSCAAIFVGRLDTKWFLESCDRSDMSITVCERPLEEVTITQIRIIRLENLVSYILR